MKGRNRRKLLKVFIYPEPLVCRLVGWPRCGQRKCVDCWAAVANISILIFGHILFLSARHRTKIVAFSDTAERPSM
jgi:hypothetical protein